MSLVYKGISLVFYLFFIVSCSIPLLANSNPDSENDDSFYLPRYNNGGLYQIKPLDLNMDGLNDILFSTGTTSRIFWGSTQGYSNSSKTDILTPDAGGVCVADFNRDGFNDIVFSIGNSSGRS